MTGPLVLPKDVQIVPLASLSANVRARIAGENHEFALTRPNSRAPSKVVDAQGAEFLREFEKPTTLVEAIVRFSKTVGREPAQVLDEVYPFLESCLVAKLLVEPGIDAEVIRASFQKGVVVANLKVLECIQALDDTELYCVGGDDLKAALKIARPGAGPQVARILKRESRILEHLDGRGSPRLLATGETEDGRAYFVTEWIAGKPCGEVAATMRAGAHEQLPVPLVSLCADILDAYANLHRLGVIHSDVHANNLLVLENGEIRIIDHGLSRTDGTDSEPAPPRGGVGFFFEPEHAQAALSGWMLPLSSLAGEQYSVGALVYFLLSGQYYLDFSYGKEDVLHEVAEQPPVPLLARGMTRAGALDDVLLRALSKDPSARFPDMAAFASAFRNAVSSISLASRPAKPSPTYAASIAGVEKQHTDTCPGDHQHLQHWLESTLNSLSDSTIDLTISQPRFLTASLTCGAAGIAYGLFRIACAREDSHLFALAERWLDRAEIEIGQGTEFHPHDIQMSPDIAAHTSPYYTPAGVACVQALLAHSSGDLRNRSIATERFLKFSDQACARLGLTTGKSGTLLALSLLLDAFRWDRTASQARLTEAGNNLLKDLWEQLDAMPAIGDSKFPTGLGMADGWAGYLYATLRWMWSAQAPPPSNVQARLQQLAEHARQRESRVSWPRDTRPNSPVFGGWCEGSAGFVFLWTLAHRVLRESQWLSLAEGAGHDACHAREEGSSLWCGLAGKAYSQLNLYKHTGERSWLENAFAIASLAMRRTEDTIKTTMPRIPFSLYHGDLGPAVLAAELEPPDYAAMPFFEDEAWPAYQCRAN